MEPSLIVQILGGILVIFFIFLIVKCTANWRWHHLMFLFCVFAASATFLFYAAMVMKTTKEWREANNRLEKQLDPELKKRDALLYGTPETAKDPMATLPGAKGEFERVTLRRGRVWRNCALTGAQNDQMVVTVPAAAVAAVAPAAPPADPAAAPAAAAPEARKLGLEPKTIVYVFAEQSLNPALAPIPNFYMGEYEVSAVNELTVSLKQTIPFGAINVPPGTTIAVFEVMPTDSHVAIDEMFAAFKLERSEEQLKAMMPKLPGTSDEAYNKMIQSHLRDNRAAQPDDPPDRVWVKVKFLKTFEVPVDSSTTAANVTRETPYYDANGLAIIPSLRRDSMGMAGPVKFKNGEFALFRQQDADKLIADGTCEKIESVYRRELHDYKQHYHEIFERIDNIVNRLAEVQRQTDDVVEASKKIDDQVKYRTAERAKLEDDLKKFRYELATIKSYSKTLHTYLASRQSQAKSYFQENLDLANQIAAVEQEITDAIDKRTAEAAGAP